MIMNVKVINYKFLELTEIYNFCFDCFLIRICLNHSKFEFQNIRTSNKILKQQMISNGKVVNKKVVEIIEIYKFCFGHFFIQPCLNNSKCMS